MTDGLTREDLTLDSLVAGVVDEFRERQNRGEKPDVEEYAARHPEAAALLRKVLATFQLLDGSPPSSPLSSGGETAGVRGTAIDDAPLSGTLGDFRLIREVGRGGMGIVYEAEQISLGRRVALKVLPFAATFDPRQLQRFHNEARAAASLRHEHIVPVFAVGQERGIHFFAMQFIDGQTIADLIKQQKAGAKPATVNETTVSGGANIPASRPSKHAADTEPVAGKSTEPIARDASSYRRAAEWGIQAAEGLEHAHSLGIVHRDIKPGNLMIDAQGQLWVADFGLARRAAESDLTMTGDLLGTLRYMSPEQALAKHDLVDHRSDVYSLGATLYELLTLRTAVASADRHEILQEIVQSEPKGLRRCDRRIPTDLETIVLKALAKEPEARYGTAKELADDLKRFLHDQPILAKRPGLVKRLSRWSRRHLTAVATVFLFLGAIAGVLAFRTTSQYLNDPERVREDIERRLMRGESVTLIGETGPPGYFEWFFGEDRTLVSTRPDRPFSVSTHRIALIGFPYAANLKRYRLRVEVRHENNPGPIGGIGVFCSYQSYAPIDGVARSSFVSLAYSDRGPTTLKPKEKGGPDGRVTLRSTYLQQYPKDLFKPRADLAYSKFFHRAMPGFDQDAPWRQLEVVMSEEGLHAFWTKDAGDRELIANIDAARIRSEERVMTGLNPPLPKLKDVRMELVPRGAFGLYVEQGVASFRRFTLELLD